MKLGMQPQLQQLKAFNTVKFKGEEEPKTELKPSLRFRGEEAAPEEGKLKLNFKA